MAIGKIDLANGEVRIYKDIKDAAIESSVSYHTLRRMAKEEVMVYHKKDECFYLGNVSIVPSRRGGERANN